MYRKALKRVSDLCGACVLIVVFAVPMVIVALCVRAFLGRPVIFRQVRPGLHARPFTLYKFRTMTTAAGNGGKPSDRDLSDEERLTGLGRFLRASSLDELPELFNILKGNMSLVGPRPLLSEYIERYNAEQARRHEVKPGITGWAQVNGRNALPWSERLALDVWYVENISPWLDLRILLRTLVKVVKREGVHAPGHATMPKFNEPTWEER